MQSYHFSGGACVPAALEALPSHWWRGGGASSLPLQVLGGSSSGNKGRGFWPLQTLPHKYTEKAEQTAIVPSGHHTLSSEKTILPGAPESRAGDAEHVSFGNENCEPGILPPIKDRCLFIIIKGFVFCSQSVLNVRTFGNWTSHYRSCYC